MIKIWQTLGTITINKQKIIDLKKSLPENVKDPMEKMHSHVGDTKNKKMNPYTIQSNDYQN